MAGSRPTNQRAAVSANNFEHLAANLVANYLYECAPARRKRRPVICVLGAEASAVSYFPPWSKELSSEIFEAAENSFASRDTFINEVCQQLGPIVGLPPRRSRLDDRRAWFIDNARLEMIAGVACSYPHLDDTIRRNLSQRFAFNDVAGPPPILCYELLSHLLKHAFVDHVITFNFDEGIDQALENELGRDGFVRIISEHDPRLAVSTKRPRLIKIHGTVSSPETMRFTYRDIGALTPGMARNLGRTFGFADSTPTPGVEIVSFGYSWQDPSFANWVVSNQHAIHNVTVVRRSPRPVDLLRELHGGKLRVISTQQLSGKGPAPLTVDHFLWALVAETLATLGSTVPALPVGRHLILGNLQSDVGSAATGTQARDILKGRAAVEILLGLAKAKGMMSVLGTTYSPRIQTYIERFRKEAGIAGATRIIEDLDLGDIIERSTVPEARDTYFAQADTVDEFVRKLAESIVVKSGCSREPVMVPSYRRRRVSCDSMPVEEFARKQILDMLEQPEVEIASDSNPQLAWVFAKPTVTSTFCQFGRRIREVLEEDWTDLLTITESIGWLGYKWLAKGLNSPKSHKQQRRIFAITCSGEGLAQWAFRSELEEMAQARISTANMPSVLKFEIPWWRHNRHLILAVKSTKRGVGLLKGVYFLRPYRKAAVAPVFVQRPRDTAKLLASFLIYLRRGTELPSEEIWAGVKGVVEGAMRPPLEDYQGVLRELLKKTESEIASRKSEMR